MSSDDAQVPPYDERAVTIQYVRSPGPGGQNVNKSATAAQLRFDIPASGLAEDLCGRLRTLAGSRLTQDDAIVIEAHRYRSQEQNREDALSRLDDLLRQAAVRPKKRRPSKPSRGAREERLSEKRIRGRKKQLRGRVRPDE